MGNAVIGSAKQSAAFRETVMLRFLEGEGKLLGLASSRTFERPMKRVVFHDAKVTKATGPQVAHYLSAVTREHAALNIGATLSVGDRDDTNVPMLLKADGFGRHTFLCGQSGSGKSYALGVILEQLLLRTDLRILVLDPNSDFVKLNELRELEDINEDRKLAGPLEESEYT
jgi:hypothetical protein